MSPSFLTQLFCCCTQPTQPAPHVETPVIPNERSRLIDSPPSCVCLFSSPSYGGDSGLLTSASSPVIIVNHQKLNDRLGTIVRAKEGKMVNVGACTPFTLHDAEGLLVGGNGNGNADAGRRSLVLTMTPERSRTSLLRSDGQSSASSRSSSRVPRPIPCSAHSQSQSRSTPSVRGSSHRVPTGEWRAESESDLSTDDEPVSPVAGTLAANSTPVAPRAPIASLSASSTPAEPQPIVDASGIAFDWGD
ncbi:hypothetical protein GGX14DRAFT_542060 [Mycena pura]|uniref:Uncharacterized protein n=1 Tax=Mycena pura TaxID=153505 RepID=A0AAD6VKB9_9AGAR|nr:hypothetical protein GGX14DRAFT_542060 [Mycena pura]